MSSDTRHLVGVDVGTKSARAGLFDVGGELLATARHNIDLVSYGADFHEQSSENIWQAVSGCVRSIIARSGIDPSSVAGIGFDATCSLVVIGPEGRPLPVGDANRPDLNIIVWMDHRAIEQTRHINTSGHPVLRYVGDRISPEMETPKLLWLKQQMPDTFKRAAHFFDLTDHLTWRASGSLARSSCTTTCKWTYLGHERRWDGSYFRMVGLSELADERFVRIGTTIVDPGTALESGLTANAAADLGLPPATPVAAGLIDAHAGGVGTVGAVADDNGNAKTRMAYVFGTSACTMTSTDDPTFVPGVWGPYYSAMVPGLWLNEAGQSAAGAAIDHLLTLHPASWDAGRLAANAGLGLGDWLAERAAEKIEELSDAALLADGLHVVPEFLGNRAPFADPDSRGLIAGLDLDRSLKGLTRLYVAGLCGVGYGLRQIVEAQREKGIETETIVVSGGAGQIPLSRQFLADATGKRIAAPRSEEPVLLGTAMLAAVAGGCYPSLVEAMSAMAAMGTSYAPAQGQLADYHRRRFEAFELLQATGRRLR